MTVFDRSRANCIETIVVACVRNDRGHTRPPAQPKPVDRPLTWLFVGDLLIPEAERTAILTIRDEALFALPTMQSREDFDAVRRQGDALDGGGSAKGTPPRPLEATRIGRTMDA